MNPFLMSPQERLTDWKRFRESLRTLDEINQLSAVAKYWAQAPLMGLAHDIEFSEKLPSPWEMISEGNWCRNSIAIGMEFTLRLAGWNSSRLNLHMLRDWDLSEVILILIIDESKTLNYNYGEVTEYPNSRHDVTGSWSFSGKLYTRISGLNTAS
jgi:hypothetical protein